MITQEEVFPIGRLGRPHGIKGELMFMFDDDVFDRTDADFLVVETEGILVPFFIEEYRFRSEQTAILKLEGIDTQEQARAMTHCRVFFLRRLADEAADGQLSWAQLTGFSLIEETDGRVVGQIGGVDDSTANVLFRVQTAAGNHLLVPAADDLIVGVDVGKREIRMTLPQGLLDL